MLSDAPNSVKASIGARKRSVETGYITEHAKISDAASRPTTCHPTCQRSSSALVAIFIL